MIERLLGRWRELPRAARWAMLAVAVILLYFAAVEPALDATNALNTAADTLEVGLAEERALRAADSAPGRDIADGQRNFGQPFLPGDKDNRPDAIHRVVDAVLGKHGVAKRTKNERRIPVRGDEIAALIPAGGSAGAGVERLVLDVTFEAAPETVIAIVSELEQAREVAAIGRVEMRKSESRAGEGAGERTVKATISPEGWVLTGPTVAASGGSP